jgi:hypothetical protein
MCRADNQAVISLTCSLLCSAPFELSCTEHQAVLHPHLECLFESLLYHGNRPDSLWLVWSARSACIFTSFGLVADPPLTTTDTCGCFAAQNDKEWNWDAARQNLYAARRMKHAARQTGFV